MTVNERLQDDWDPKSDAVQRDQRAAYDGMRERCPVAYSDFLGWSLFRHQDIVRVLNDPDTFSNAVSRHLSVPDGMDPPEHTEFRRMIMPYFRPERVDAFEPQCREIAANLLQSLLERDELEFIADFAHWFAVRIQCASLGWPLEMCEPLRLWTQKNHQATFARDRQAMTEIAREFEGYVHQLLQSRRAAGAQAGDDITSSLLRQEVQGRPLRDEEIVSVLRNWTVGEVGTISAALGILVHYLSQHPDLQQQLRAQPSLLPAAIEEILRIHGPLVANRRITTRPVEIGGRTIAAGERLSLIWISANRDGRVFEDPEAYRADRDQAENLLYGAGIHVCPGAPLARMEMRVAMEELLGRTTGIAPIPAKPPTAAVYPGSGFATLNLRIR
ncbi:cytochrome P450 [Accumulibacter sp.]|uniref:cytochrome P450 n=1 Tax=Accumulibacter sp. TaxID=2053492 RepID=UPI00262B931A|nr:cytochrome P450 [Accumulibacter sp.]